MLSRFQSPIQGLINELVANADERGLQVAAYVDGELVLDAWAGVADRETERAVDAGTLFPVFSVTKGMVATAVHQLAEKGLLDYDAPIAKYWPEFAANGKAETTVRQAMGHTAGLYRMPENLDHVKLGNWDFMVEAIAAEPPAHKPGEQQIYHAMTYGWIMGELVRRIDGRPFEQYLEETLNAPLGIENLYCSIPDEVESRVAILEEDATDVPDNLGNGSVPSWVTPLHAWMNRADARRACIPASSGIMNARSMARHYAALLPGGVDGVKLLPASRVKIATERQLSTEPTEARFGLGYPIGGDPESLLGESGFGHGGYGGSIAFADPIKGFSFALCKNRFNKEDNTIKVVRAFRELL